MGADTEKKYTLRKDFKKNITNTPLKNFLRKYSIQFTEISEDLISKLEENVDNGKIPYNDLYEFLEHETRYGHNRTMFCYEIATEDLNKIRSLNITKLENLLRIKGWELPELQLIDFYLPEKLLLAEYTISTCKEINLTFVETINISGNEDKVIKKDNNFYFVTINPNEKIFSVRMRPRANAVKVVGGNISNKINDVQLFYKIKKIIEDIFSINLITSIFFKNTLYEIAKDMTEKGEEEWKKEVSKYKKEINDFAEEMQSKLPGIDPEIFDLKFRLTRLFERALIKSNFTQLKVNKPGKKGYVHMFHFSDKAGGKIKASSKEKEKAIELSEIYYDTRDTIDKSRAYDILWVYWFQKNEILRTKLEATSEYYQIHFYKYLSKDDIFHVLSEIRNYQNK
ncbi:hypothetical protein [Alteribacillus sp. HJP-4]|uniref:hypothetical protein n=1 Tax=Alteribacillus sp. HJP-4 TaxID=2775394 RepID=UPI0035CD1C51